MLTNKGLVEYVKIARVERWGYVWGTFGLLLTDLLFSHKLEQYPDGVGKYKEFISKTWLGRKTTDCVGLIKGYYWTIDGVIKYNLKTDVSANRMYTIAKEKGTISTMPDMPGICVWKDGHIGVYIGDGQVIEAHGTKYGVIQTPLKGAGATAWTHWLKCPYIVYEESEMTLVEALAFISKSGIDIDYWMEQCNTVKFLDQCFIKIAKVFKEV
jgi:hypothetical protein